MNAVVTRPRSDVTAIYNGIYELEALEVVTRPRSDVTAIFCASASLKQMAL